MLPAEAEQPKLAREEQRRRLERFVGEQGWALAGVFEDVGVRARPRHQPELRRLLESLERFDKVVVARLDRLGPQTGRVADLLRRLARERVDLVSVEERFDTGAESGASIPGLVWTLAGWGWSDWRPAILSRPGLEPATVIDVGVADGTLGLRDAFPSAHHVLIEPLEEFRRDLERLVAEHGGEYLLTAIGAEEGTTTIDVHPRDLLMSSSFAWQSGAEGADGGPGSAGEKRTVPLTTLDRLLEQRGWRGPFGLKLDAEGAEYDVIRGSERLLEQTQFVIAEVSVGERFEGGYTFADFIALMDAHGFRLDDLLSAPKLPTGGVSYVDGLFTRKP
jgi:FkbM family methyltransferase